MQALQFLNQQSAVSQKDIAFDVSKEKESDSSSFKTLLEKASKKDDVTDKSDKTSKKEKLSTRSPKSKDDGTGISEKTTPENNCIENEVAEVSEKDSVVASDKQVETVLFGQIIEQVNSEQGNMTLASTDKLEDVTVQETVFDTISFANQEQTVPSSSILEAYDAKHLDNAEVLAENVSILAETSDISANEKTEAELAANNQILNTEGESAVMAENLEVAQNITDKQNSKLSDKSSRQEKDTESKTDISSKTNHITENSVFTVVDERTAVSKVSDKNADSENKLLAESVKKSGNSINITFNYEQQAVQQNILSENNQTASADGSVFQKMLSNQLMNQAPEFVKAGSIVLRDNDNGTINLNLKPESLGNVKITLQITDKGIEGQITVASKEAFEAFKQNMDNLKQSFQQSGFDNANLNLSLANNGSHGGNFENGQQRSSEDFFANKTFNNYAESGDKTTSVTVANAYNSDGYHVDVVA